MRTVQVQEAETELSALLDAAERGEPTAITRNGKPSAILVSVEAARQLYGHNRPNFGSFLMSFPGDIDPDRQSFGLRELDL